MKQFWQVKAKYPGAIILFRVGDFYETFAEDAVKTATTLGLVLTKRGNGSASEVELAGFPHHSLDTYLPKLVRAGYRVAVCDQLEDPKMAKGLVKRGVTELVSPGVAYSDKVLDAKRSNYLASVFKSDKQVGIAFLDISTGEFFVTAGNIEMIDKLLGGFKPSEIIIAKNQQREFPLSWQDSYIIQTLDAWVFQPDYASDKLKDHFKTVSLKGFRIEDETEMITAAGAALHYAAEACFDRLQHINTLQRIETDNYVWLDAFTIRNLEILQPIFPGGKALVDVIDRTLSPMGSRTLRNWIVLPLKEQKPIQERLDIVEFFFNNPNLRIQITELLKQVGDIERIISRVALLKSGPRELLQLAKGLKISEEINTILKQSGETSLIELADRINPCQSISEKIINRISEDAPAVIAKGGVFNIGFDKELDELRDITQNGKGRIAEIHAREVSLTGIPSLKIGFNNVFGYYLEVTHAHKSKVPENWIRKQTLTNAERYVTPELKELEEKILNAETLILQRETQLYEEFLQHIISFVEPIRITAFNIGTLDCLCSFAELSVSNRYCKPEIINGFELELKSSRHPVIEKQLPAGESYIDNDIRFDEEQRIIILTGPNMSGKSALLRQTALAVLMAQIGCFVAADSARIGIVDKIYTRVGASDNISLGESTFMVEMLETAGILNNISKNSLVLLDEIGRGTATFDGVSLAWAIAEFIATHPQSPKTLFATHYHELNELENKLQGVKNFHISIKEVSDKILFLRKLVEGGSESSFGIHVAKMAGVPKAVTDRASLILEELEKDRAAISGKETLKKMKRQEVQMTMFGISDPRLEEMRRMVFETDVNSLSPIEALMKLNELKKVLEGGR
ncbi:MAG: DNA mismatch repair protein MutS [Bacteroidetes bacterium]|nr:DNA mismatch repair protein MutS [Bacteroidota bacterium]